MSIINFTVQYDLYASQSDSADTGVDADIVPLMGEVRFTPVTADDKPVQAPTYSPRPAGIKLLPFFGYMDSDGQLKAGPGGAVGVRLWANDPVLGLSTGLTYRVDFDLRTPVGEKVTVDGGYFSAPSVDGTVNLADVLTSTGSPVVGLGGGGDNNLYAREIVDSTTVGRALITAASAAAARAAIGAVGKGDLVYNVKDYGATGNGTTDDTAAIHAARDAAGVGGTVVFPVGTYKIVGNNDGTGALQANVAGQTWIIGANATIIQYNHARALITVSAAGVTLTGGGTLNGGRSTLGTDGPGVALGNNAYNVLAIVMGTKDSTDLVIENLTITEGSQWGVWAQASRSRVLGCRFTKCWGTSIQLKSDYLAVQIGSTMQDTYDMEASYNFIDRSDQPSATADYLGIQIRGNPGSATTGDDPKVAYRPKALYNTILLARNPDDATGRVIGIEIARAYQGLAQGNRVVNGAMGVSFARNAYGQSIGNTFIGSSLFAQELSDSVGCIVQGNIIDGDGIGGTKSSGSGITGQGSSGLSTDVTIVGNRIFNVASTCRPISGAHSRWVITGNSIDAKYGIQFTGQSDSIVSGNSFKGDTTAPAVVLTNSSSIAVTGNTFRDFSAGVQVYASSGTSDYVNVTGNHFRACTIPVDGVTAGGTVGTNIINANNTVRA